MFARIALALGIIAFASLAGAAEKQAMPDKDHRCLDTGSAECTELVPVTELLKNQSTPLPQAVEDAFAKGYGELWIRSTTLAGSVEKYRCGAGLYDVARRLIITAQHCLPDYSELLGNGSVTFRDVIATYIASIPEADMAMFQLERIPGGMEPLEWAEAVVGETVYARSMQRTPLLAPSQSKALPVETFFLGPVSATGTVEAKGIIGIGHMKQKAASQALSEELEPTPYHVLRLSADVGENGFSGGPVFNEFGQVVGISSCQDDKKTFVTAATNIPLLLERYKP